MKWLNIFHHVNTITNYNPIICRGTVGSIEKTLDHIDECKWMVEEGLFLSIILR